MMIQTPAQALANRTARLVAEGAHRDRVAYTTDTQGAARKRLSNIERDLCTEDWCFVCSRPTDHFGEHDDEQLDRAGKRRGM